MGVVHVTEAQLARNLRGVLEKVEAGAEVIVERGDRPVAVMRRPAIVGPADEYTPAQRRVIDARLNKAIEEVKRGRTAGPFDTADEMIAALRREIRKRAARRGRSSARRSR
ncbi:MAG TPA: hypothetical protein VIY49_04285 [Bryobacteraceae bacterium]